MKHRIHVFFILLIASAATKAADEPVGCYKAQITSKSGVEQAKSLRLTNEPASTPWGNGGANQIFPADADEHFNYSAAYWVIDKNELVITFSNNGLSGIELRLHQVKNGFQGVVQNFWDFDPEITDVRPVALERIDCTSKPRAT